MKVGACGIACDPACGLFVKEICPGCAPDLVERIPCPILKCAVKKEARYCGKDCDEFPCQIFQKGFPFSEAFLGMYTTRMAEGR